MSSHVQITEDFKTNSVLQQSAMYVEILICITAALCIATPVSLILWSMAFATPACVSRNHLAADFYRVYKSRNLLFIVFAFSTVVSRCWYILELDALIMLHKTDKFNLRTWAVRQRKLWVYAAFGFCIFTDLGWFLCLMYEDNICSFQDSAPTQAKREQAWTLRHFCSYTVQLKAMSISMYISNLITSISAYMLARNYLKHYVDKYKQS